MWRQSDQTQSLGVSGAVGGKYNSKSYLALFII